MSFVKLDALKFYLNSLVIETFARLRGAEAFLETMSDGIPTIEEKEHRVLEQLAAEGSWDPEDYFVERDILRDNFRTWIPTFAAYSGVILLHSIVETQLSALAEHLGKRRGANLQLNDLSGKGVDRSANFLKLVLSIDVKADKAWSKLKDLQSLRNVIVHRGGKRAEGTGNASELEKLIQKYPTMLELRKAGFHEQIWVSMNLCRSSAKNIDGFFDRVFGASGLPNRHGKLDN